MRTNDREIRAAKRELRPIQERARQQTRAARRQRLKENIKATHGGAAGMQKLWRGYTVRSVLGEVDINELMCWIEAWDEERAQPYFYNTFSEETKWDVPQELQDNRELRQRLPGVFLLEGVDRPPQSVGFAVGPGRIIVQQDNVFHGEFLDRRERRRRNLQVFFYQRPVHERQADFRR